MCMGQQIVLNVVVTGTPNFLKITDLQNDGIKRGTNLT